MRVLLRRDAVVLRILAGCLFSLALVLIGCGPPSDQPPLGTVSGTITKNGKPLPGAWITFTPESGRLSHGRTNDQGQYTLQYTGDVAGAKVGTHTVKIGVGGGPPDHSSRAAARKNVKKQLYQTSGVTVESGENPIDFEITEGNEYQGAAARRK